MGSERCMSCGRDISYGAWYVGRVRVCKHCYERLQDEVPSVSAELRGIVYFFSLVAATAVMAVVWWWCHL